MLPSGYSAVRPTGKPEGAGDAFSMGENKLRRSYVYFIQRGEGGAKTSSLKVGVSYDPEARVRQLQTGSSVALKLIHVIDAGSRPNSFALEKRIHSALKSCARHGEWFALTGIASRLVNSLSLTERKDDFWDCLSGKSKKKVSSPDNGRESGLVELVTRLKKVNPQCKESAYLLGFYAHQLGKDVKKNLFGWSDGPRPDNRDWWYMGYLDSMNGRSPMVNKLSLDELCPEKGASIEREID